MAECNDSNTPLTNANPQQLSGSPILNNDAKGVTGGVGTGVSSFFNVNNVVSAAQNYAAINNVVNELLGYEFKWFRAVPQQRSKDVIFQEYTLSNVEECPIEMKAVISQNSTNIDSKYTYDLNGLEYEIPFEIQIDKRYWESKAGFGTGPQKKDIVYFPMANKLFQVESSYVIRGFMEQETGWRINLRKYQPESSRRESDALKDTIDKYTVSAEEIFGTAVNNDIQKLVDDKQFSAFNGTSQDKYKTVDASLRTINKSINIYGTVVSQSYYDMMSSLVSNAIVYKPEDNIDITDDRSLTAWIQPRTIPSVNKQYSVDSITPVVSLDVSSFYVYDTSLYNRANYIVTLSTPILLSNISIDDNVVISRPGALNLYAKIVAISIDPLRFYCAINPFVLEDLNAIKTDWYLQKGYTFTRKEPISVLDGVNAFGEHVLSVNVYANQYIAISYGHTYAGDDSYVVRMDDKLEDDKWYGLVVNIGNTWNQYNVQMWKQHETDKNAKLESIFYETLRLYPENIGISNYSVNKSPSYLTNIRLFNTTIEEEKQSNELLSYFSQDSDQLIISDSCDPILLLQYISKQR
jgi:hypothetical protein